MSAWSTAPSSSLSLPTVSLISSQWGVVLAEVIYFTPFALLPALAALQVMDTSQVEVAEALGAKPWRIVRRVIIPEILPSVLAGGSLVLLRAMNDSASSSSPAPKEFPHCQPSSTAKRLDVAITVSPPSPPW
jgi:ABC-type Fe3+ transport system permease subunit